MGYNLHQRGDIGSPEMRRRMTTVADIAKFLDKAYEQMSFADLAKAPVAALQGVSDADGDALAKALGIKTIADPPPTSTSCGPKPSPPCPTRAPPRRVPPRASVFHPAETASALSSNLTLPSPASDRRGGADLSVQDRSRPTSQGLALSSRSGPTARPGS